MGMPAPSPDNPHLSTHFRQGRAIVLHCHQDTEKGTAAAGKKPPRKEMSGTDRCRRRRGKKEGVSKDKPSKGGWGWGVAKPFLGAEKREGGQGQQMREGWVW